MARAAKRRRQKEGRRHRIEAEVHAYRAGRRRRLLVGLAALLAFAGVIAGSIFTSQREEPKPKDEACSATQPPKGDTTPTLAAPAITLDPAVAYSAKIETSCGLIEVELAKDISPNTVNAFVYLAKRGFYNGLTFHRIVKGFVIQGGDPTGNGSGGSGFQVTDPPPPEFKYPRGTLAMAKTGADPAGTAGSQFFLVTGNSPQSLAGTAENPAQYAVLGKVTKGLAVLSKLDGLATQQSPSGEMSLPTRPVYIVRITIVET